MSDKSQDQIDAEARQERRSKYAWWAAVGLTLLAEIMLFVWLAFF